MVAGSSMGDGRPLRTFLPSRIHPPNKVSPSVGVRQMSALPACVSGKMSTGWINLFKPQ